MAITYISEKSIIDKHNNETIKQGELVKIHAFSSVWLVRKERNSQISSFENQVFVSEDTCGTFIDGPFYDSRCKVYVKIILGGIGLSYVKLSAIFKCVI